MLTVNSLAQGISVLWIVSEIFLLFLKRAKSKSRDLNKSNAAFLWTIILSIIIGINIAQKSAFGRVEYPLLSYIAIVLVLSGAAVRWTAIVTLGRHFTTTLTIVDNHKIVDGGIYKYIRHPSYTGALMSFLGFSITFANWITPLVIFIPILFAYIYRINNEEKLLTEHFGEAYIAYTKKTHRLIPKIY